MYLEPEDPLVCVPVLPLQQGQLPALHVVLLGDVPVQLLNLSLRRLYLEFYTKERKGIVGTGTGIY